MTLRRFPAALIVSLCAVATVDVAAHHGFRTHYDVANPVRIEGKIQTLRYRNPHTIVQVAVSQGDGENVIWTCETQAKSLLVRKGITADRFPVGADIVIVGSRARRQEHGCEVNNMLLPDGELITVRSTEGHANIAVNAAPAEQASNTVFGHWVRDSFSGAPVNHGFLQNISDAGRAANAGYKGATDDPTRVCSPVNPVRAMFAPGTPSEIRREDSRVIIRHEFMDTIRVVELGSTTNVPVAAPTEMGTSTGQLENGRLVVLTDNFAPGVLLTHVEDSGVLHSDQMTLREEFSVDEATGNLIYSWAATDPLYFPIPIDGQLALSPSSLNIDSYDCQPQIDD